MTESNGVPIWAYYHSPWPQELTDLAEPKGGMRVLKVIGFVLADPFDTFLRQLSTEYLQSAWQHLDALLNRYKIKPNDLTWAYLHVGTTRIDGVTAFAPHQFLGWSSQDLYLANREGTSDVLSKELDDELKKLSPSVRRAVTDRSVKWHIDPENFEKGLEIIEVMCTAEPPFWAPEVILQDDHDPSEPWIQVAGAILQHDQRALDRALQGARESYTPLGYRIVLRGYATYALDEPTISLNFPTDELVPDQST